MKHYIGKPPFQWQGEINQESQQLNSLISLFHPLTHWRDLLSSHQMTPVGHAKADGVNQHVGRTYALDGTDDCAYTTLPSAWKLQRFTLSTWVRLASAGGGAIFSLVPRGSAADARGVVFTAYTTYIYFFFGAAGGSFIYSNTGAALTAGETYHVAYSYNGANMVCYINGKQDSTKTASYTISYADKAGSYGPNPASAYIGGYHNSTNTSPATTADILYEFNGQIGPVSLYNRALLAAEIWQLYDPQTRWELYATPMQRTWFIPQSFRPHYARSTYIAGVNHHA